MPVQRATTVREPQRGFHCRYQNRGKQSIGRMLWMLILVSLVRLSIALVPASQPSVLFSLSPPRTRTSRQHLALSSTQTTSESNKLTEFSEADTEDMNHEARFGGISRLYSAHKMNSADSSSSDETLLDRLQKSTVVVVGLGGVGSWAAEALCRSGVGHLALIDLDDICISNTNRQLHTTSATVGQFKIDVLADRFRSINPRCHVTCINDFVSAENVHSILDEIHNTSINELGGSGITAVLDAIDGSTAKAALLAACTDRKLPTVTVGGAAGRLDPSAIVCHDLSVVKDDKLLSTCRKYLRKDYGFPPGAAFHEKKKKVKKFRLPAVYSTERVPDIPASATTSNLRQCDGALGTACFVTGTFGFMAASQIMKGIAKNNLKPPRR